MFTEYPKCTESNLLQLRTRLTLVLDLHLLEFHP
jgi:hypothetical protein